MALSRTREFDADLEAARLTGDPDGLASALQKLEKAQGRLWEGVILPGGRIPDPSILRSHPLTDERVARLQSLKLDQAAGSLAPDVSGEGRARPRLRPSLVPRIARHSGPSLPRLHALVEDPGQNEAEMDDSAPASDAPLNPPAGSPRIRAMRGGVWW